MAADHAQVTDELVLRDLPGTMAILVVALATLALGWEVWGVLFHFGTFMRPLAALELGDIVGVALFAIGWLGLLVGLLVLRHRRHAPAN